MGAGTSTAVSATIPVLPNLLHPCACSSSFALSLSDFNPAYCIAHLIALFPGLRPCPCCNYCSALVREATLLYTVYRVVYFFAVRLSIAFTFGPKIPLISFFRSLCTSFPAYSSFCTFSCRASIFSSSALTDASAGAA